MSKRSRVRPDWLDDMLVIWGFRDARQALGFPPISPMFKERIGAPARSFESTGYTSYDMGELETALGNLRQKLGEIDENLAQASTSWDEALDQCADQNRKTVLLDRMSELLSHRSYIRHLVRGIQE